MANNPSWIGKKLSDRYEIEDLLGQGGMSSVYKANDPNLHRTVAIKLIHPHLSSDQQFVDRFEDEAAAVAKIRHPNIIQVYDYDNDGETYYMVLEYILGETLEEQLKRLAEKNQFMSPKDAIKICASVCDALHYAHARGMIHRDIKPANIMQNVEGQTILMDFGVAKIIGGKQHTATGAVVGTALYMSPEVIKGEQPDFSVDIYSLGVTLFQALSGKPPFVADSAMSTLMMHVNDPVPDIQQLNAEIPDALVAVIKKALAKDKKDRFSSADKFAKALRAIDLSAPGRAAPIESLDPGVGATMIETPTSLPPSSATMIEEPTGLTGSGATMVEQETVPAAAPPSKIPPPVPSPASAAGAKKKGFLTGGALIAAIVGGCILVSVIGFFGMRAFSSDSEETPTDEPVAVVLPTETTAPVEPTEEILTTDITEPTATLAPTPPPEPYVLIMNISPNGSNYVVEYDTYGYTEALPGQHIHFFWNNVPPAQAGVGGTGPWFVWGGPRPFDRYTIGDRPSVVTQICGLVANPNHTIISNTGNCYDLPE